MLVFLVANLHYYFIVIFRLLNLQIQQLPHNAPKWLYKPMMTSLMFATWSIVAAAGSFLAFSLQ
jgi:hypothetical protein